MTWLVVHTKPRQEAVATSNLRRQGFEVFLPEVQQRKRQRGRWQWLTLPLFPRYLFLQIALGEQDVAKVRSTLGVANLVRFGSNLAQVEEPIISFLRAQQVSLAKPFEPDYRAGDTVAILEGPFAGLNGIYQLRKDIARVELLLSLMGRELPVALQLDQVGCMT